METKEIIINGITKHFRMTREKGFFTRHIWVYLDNVPYLHLLPTDTGTAKINKNCGKYGYLPFGELMKDFEKITLNDLINF